ncbi:Os01g0703150 [Oryza sativa Japonica Group]|uniref:Os01g0703150 protein n=1 Tax=Oryza sativa subsp. japonica TaxID=39947 RepID=A0A0P0V743_ORYSJ|nr:Os01g0703150 [Oryza sativa Japonica Group]
MNGCFDWRGILIRKKNHVWLTCKWTKETSSRVVFPWGRHGRRQPGRPSPSPLPPPPRHRPSGRRQSRPAARAAAGPLTSSLSGGQGAVLGEAAVTARSGPLRPDLAGRQLAAARVAATTAGMELAEGAEAAAVPPRSAPLGRIWRVEAVGRRQLATTTTTAGGSRRWSRPDLDAGGSGRRRRQCGDGSGGGRGPAATWWLPCHLATAVEAMASGCYLLGGGGRWRNGGFAEAVVGVGGSGDGGCDSRGGDDVGGGEGVGCEVGMMTARWLGVRQ